MKYRVTVLYSGSTGNATLIETPEACFLIDAGKNVKSLTAALRAVGSDLSRIQAIFITHEHRDHIGALEVLSGKHRIPIFMHQACAERILEDPMSRAKEHIKVFGDQFAFRIGDAVILAFPVPHDSRGCVGYRIFLQQGGETCNIGYATDIGMVTDELRKGLYGCETVVLESNHDTEMLLTGNYPYDLKLRIRGKGGHLSNTESAELSSFLAETGMKRLILAHLSQENNTPELALAEHTAALAGTGVEILASNADDPVEIRVEDTRC